MTGLLDQHEIYYNYNSSSVLDSTSLGELFITPRTLWTIIWTTVTIMPLILDPKVVPAVNGTSPPLPFVFRPQGNHFVSLQCSTSWAVDTIVGSTEPIMSRRLDTNVPSTVEEASRANDWRIPRTFARAIDVVHTHFIQFAHFYVELVRRLREPNRVARPSQVFLLFGIQHDAVGVKACDAVQVI